MGVIGGHRWFEWGLKLAGMVRSGEIKSFSPDEREEALNWIKA
jgi:hypothetical protein